MLHWGERPGKSCPTAFRDWANTTAACRVFANGNVSEDRILAGHFAASALRAKAVADATSGPVLVLQDTTEVSFERAAPEKIGVTKTSCGHKTREGRPHQHAICGMLMQASLAVTPEGLPLGLTAAKFWSCETFRGTKALAREVNPTRVPIEQKESTRWLDTLRLSTDLIGAPERCVHIGDRESDILELFCLAHEMGTNFLVRPPIGKQKRYEHQKLQIIHAAEIDAPDHREPLLRKLITNVEVASFEQAVERLESDARRWRIETVFKTLKTGCRIEKIRLTTADRLANCIALACITAWRIFWMTMLRRAEPVDDPAAVFTDMDLTLLARTAVAKTASQSHDLEFCLTAVARLDAYLARRRDPPPGTTVLWRGFSRLADLVIGFEAAIRSGSKTCG